MIRCGLYIRVSTDMQKERGESLEVQLKRLRARVDSKDNWSVVEIYKDAGVSAKNINRPEFNRMKADIEAGKLDAILCTKLDRVFRNTNDFLNTSEYFEKNNINFVCLEGDIDTSTPSGRVFSTMKAAFAQFERETTAERVRDVMCSRAEQGKYNGGIAPYGYFSKDKKLVINQDETKVVSNIYKLYLEHGSILHVTHELNNNGVKTRKGEFWSATSIRRILTSSFYYGEVVYNKRSHTYRGELKHNPKAKFIRGKGDHQSIVTKEMFDKVQTIISMRSKNAPKANAKYLLTGLVYCNKCGSRMHGALHVKPNGLRYNYYKCAGHTQKGNAKCTGTSIDSNGLEDSILSNLKDLDINYNRIREALQEQDGLKDKSCDQIKAFQEQLNKIRSKRQRIFELYENCNINKSEFIERKTLVDAEEADINRRLDELRDNSGSMDIESFDVDATSGFCKEIREVYDELGMEDRKELIRNLLSEIKIDKHVIDYSIQIPPKLLSRAQGLVLSMESSDTGRGSLPQQA